MFITLYDQLLLENCKRCHNLFGSIQYLQDAKLPCHTTITHALTCIVEPIDKVSLNRCQWVRRHRNNPCSQGGCWLIIIAGCYFYWGGSVSWFHKNISPTWNISTTIVTDLFVVFMFFLINVQQSFHQSKKTQSSYQCCNQWTSFEFIDIWNLKYDCPVF